MELMMKNCWVSLFIGTSCTAGAQRTILTELGTVIEEIRAIFALS